MAHRWYAIVRMDDHATTNSTGGVVEAVRYDDENAVYRQEYTLEDPHTIPYKIPEGCQKIPCTEEVKPGWIYTDKTHQFVDSNVSNN